MDVDKIFGLFNNKELNSFPEESNLGISLDLKEHPLFWVGLFKKIIHKQKIFNYQSLQLFDEMNEELDINDIKKAGEYIIYNKAWYWISKVDIKDRKCQEAILYYTDKLLESYIKSILFYFQELEEYEKCAHLKKILELVQILLT
jgi:hypothetical protein